MKTVFLLAASLLCVAWRTPVAEAQQARGLAPAGAYSATKLTATAATAAATAVGVDPGSTLAPVVTTLRVEARESEVDTAGAPTPEIRREEILSSAGTYGDFARYLQTLPGVVGTSDLANDVLVRGGHPTENLFVIDGVEFPSLNHFALQGTSGGFTSMLDTTAVGEMTMHAGVWDVDSSSRLSSAVEIHTRHLEGERTQAGNLAVGISGAGGMLERALPGKGEMLMAFHRSIMNLVTNDIGINGVPIYTNLLSRVDMERGPDDSLTMLSLSGIDSIAIVPCPGDVEATSFYQTHYAGWRTNDALSWRHIYSPRTLGTLTATAVETRQTIDQQRQEGATKVNGVYTCQVVTALPVYNENTRNAEARVKYTLRSEGHGWIWLAGGEAGLTRPDLAISQPNAQQSPFSAAASTEDVISVRRNFYSGQTAVFGQGEGELGRRWRLMAGVRMESFALSGSVAFNPRVALTYRLSERQSLHGSWNSSSQLPPTANYLTYSSNRTLRPIHVNQMAAGMRLWQGGWGTVDLDAYRKLYTNEPVSTEYPQLSLTNMVDTLGQSFTWLPLVSRGTGEARGVELSARARLHSRAQMSLAFSRSQVSYRALDGVKRPGNYDFPIMGNLMLNLRLPARIQLNGRESISSGKVYCPFDKEASIAQDRGIYDLTRINSVRGPLYNRLDIELDRRFSVGRGELNLQLGAQNVLNRGNLYGYVWMNNCPTWDSCYTNGLNSTPTKKIDQVGRYPVMQMRWEF